MSLLGDDTVPNLTGMIQQSSRYCQTCGRTYDSNRQQAACPHDPWVEVADTEEPTVALAAPLNDGDYALAPDPPAPKALTPQQLHRLGALTLQDERSDAVESLLTDQEAVYREMLRRNPAELVTVLLERDRLLANQGRQMADGRMGARLLREFVRGALSLADHASLRRVGDATKAGSIEGILGALGAEPADLRQLKLSGTTMGSEVDQAERAHQLAEGKLKR